MAPAGWVCVPADSSHPRGPRRARGASALMVPSSGLLRTEGEAGGVGARLAACCPACPQPREQTFRPQGIALMSPESRDDRRPGVREQGWEFFITIRRASLCSLQVAAGCPASQRKSVVEMHSLLLAGYLLCDLVKMTYLPVSVFSRPLTFKPSISSNLLKGTNPFDM